MADQINTDPGNVIITNKQCFFCNDPATNSETVNLHKIVNSGVTYRDSFKKVTTTLYDTHKIEVPLCADCVTFKKTRASNLGVIFGAGVFFIICLLSSWLGYKKNIDTVPMNKGIMVFLILFVIGTVGLFVILIYQIVDYRRSIKKYEKKKEIKIGKKTILDYPEVLEYVANGWTVGEKPQT